MFQWFLRGVGDSSGNLDEEWAKRVLNHDGLRSAWLRANAGSDPADWDEAVGQHGPAELADQAHACHRQWEVMPGRSASSRPRQLGLR